MSIILQGVLDFPWPDDPTGIDLVGWAQIRSRMREASAELSRLQGLLEAHDIDSGSEYICRCGLRREAAQGEPIF